MRISNFFNNQCQCCNVDEALTNCIRRLTTREANMRTKEQCFKVVRSLLKSSSTSSFKHVYFNHLRNVVDFVRLVNNETSIIVLIIRSYFIQAYKERLALNSLKRKNSN